MTMPQCKFESSHAVCTMYRQGWGRTWNKRSIWIASVPVLSHPSESRIRLSLRGRQFISRRSFLSFFTWCASVSQRPLLNVCVLVVPHHRRSPPNPLYRLRLVSPSPRLPGTSGREKSPAIFPQSADSLLCPPLPLPSRPRRERRGERVWKGEEEAGGMQVQGWTGKEEEEEEEERITERVKTPILAALGASTAEPFRCGVQNLTWTLLCFSSS